MNKEISEALLDFYQKFLAPEFESIKKKQATHDEKFIDILGHFDALYKHLSALLSLRKMSLTNDLKPIA